MLVHFPLFRLSTGCRLAVDEVLTICSVVVCHLLFSCWNASPNTHARQSLVRLICSNTASPVYDSINHVLKIVACDGALPCGQTKDSLFLTGDIHYVLQLYFSHACCHRMFVYSAYLFTVKSYPQVRTICATFRTLFATFCKLQFFAQYQTWQCILFDLTVTGDSRFQGRLAHRFCKCTFCMLGFSFTQRNCVAYEVVRSSALSVHRFARYTFAPNTNAQYQMLHDFDSDR